MNNPMPMLFFGLLALLWMPLSAPGDDSADFQEGTHYRRLATPVPTSTDDKIEVVELFWYGCPHCYQLESHIDRWLDDKPKNVKFVRIPAVLNRNWELGARAYYTAEALGVVDKIHSPLMDAIHAQRRRIAHEADLADFFAEHGVDKETFHRAFKSFDVETRLRRSQQLVQRYGVYGVPSFIVNGKYETTGSMAGSQDRIFEVVNYLVRKEDKQG